MPVPRMLMCSHFLSYRRPGRAAALASRRRQEIAVAPSSSALTGTSRTAAGPSGPSARSSRRPPRPRSWWFPPRSSVFLPLGQAVDAALVAVRRAEPAEPAAHRGCRRRRTRGGRLRSSRTEPAPRALLERLGLVDAHRRLLGRVPRLHVQVVRRLDAPLPRGGVDRHHVAEVAGLEVHVAADGLVDPLLRPRRDLEEGVRREL